MTDVEASYEGFLASRRSGRRNAIHGIETAPGEGASDLMQSLSQLNINKSADEKEESNQDSPSKEEETQERGSS